MADKMLEKVARATAYIGGLGAGAIVARACWAHGANIPQGLTIALVAAFVVWRVFTAMIDAILSEGKA